MKKLFCPHGATWGRSFALRANLLLKKEAKKTN